MGNEVSPRVRKDERMGSRKHDVVLTTGGILSDEEMTRINLLNAEIVSKRSGGGIAAPGRSWLDVTLDLAKNHPGVEVMVNGKYPDVTYINKRGKRVTRNQANSVASSIRRGDKDMPGKYKGCGRGTFKTEAKYIEPGYRTVFVTYTGPHS